MAALGLSMAPCIGSAAKWPSQLRPYCASGFTYNYLSACKLSVDRLSERPIAEPESYDIKWNPYIGFRFAAGLWLPAPKSGCIFGEVEYQTGRTAKTEHFGPVSVHESYMRLTSDFILLNLYYQLNVANAFQPYFGVGCGTSNLKGEACFFSDETYAFNSATNHRMAIKGTAGFSFALNRSTTLEAEFVAIHLSKEKREKRLTASSGGTTIATVAPSGVVQLSLGLCNTF
ncbi:MAG: hypothetical protein LBB14_03220 [Puniceicoccales bacterium]|nr:hypothetical protein [Puniceicoccales bacterium]